MHTHTHAKTHISQAHGGAAVALSHFAAGPDARRLSLLLKHYGGSGDGGAVGGF